MGQKNQTTGMSINKLLILFFIKITEILDMISPYSYFKCLFLCLDGIFNSIYWFVIELFQACFPTFLSA